MKIVAGYQNTKKNNEDFALTPYLFLVIANCKIIQVYGIGICWAYFSIYIALAFNLPKGYKKFTRS